MPEITYGRLDEVLRGLGFAYRVVTFDAPARVYDHPTGATVRLPLFPDTDPVLPRHLLAVRTELDNFGVADPLDFDAKLRKVG